MATHLDYIFIDENNANLISQIDTRFGNSDHLLVECILNFSTKRKKSLFGDLTKIASKMKN